MPDRIAKAMEVGDVCLGEGEAVAPSYIRATICTDIEIVQVHQSRGTLIIELLVGEPDLVVRRIVVPVDIHPNPGRARELEGMKLGHEGFTGLAVLHISDRRRTAILTEKDPTVGACQVDAKRNPVVFSDSGNGAIDRLIELANVLLCAGNRGIQFG